MVFSASWSFCMDSARRLRPASMRSRPDGVGGEPGPSLVELPGETGSLGVRDPRLYPLLRSLIQQRTLGLQVARCEPLPLVELVQADGEVGKLFLGAPPFFLRAPRVGTPPPEQQ